MLSQLKKDMQQFASPGKAHISQRFFKTAKGEYGEGDIFIGLTVPEQRTIAKKYSSLSFQDIKSLLQSKIHEHRLTALLILVEQFHKSSSEKQKEIFSFYLRNTEHINNWDLVDLSADKIAGAYLYGKPEEDKEILYPLAQSKNLWERRIAIISTFHFIKNNQFDDTLKIAELLLHDEHDLIQKAVGWMLRELGKRHQEIEEQFLKKHCTTMPRTMLRYAIERFSEAKKRSYLER